MPSAVTPRCSLPLGPGSHLCFPSGFACAGRLRRVWNARCVFRGPSVLRCVSRPPLVAGRCPSVWVHGCLPVTCWWTLWFFPLFGSCEQSCCGRSGARFCEDVRFPCSGRALLLVLTVWVTFSASFPQDCEQAREPEVAEPMSRHGDETDGQQPTMAVQLQTQVTGCCDSHQHPGDWDLGGWQSGGTVTEWIV